MIQRPLTRLSRTARLLRDIGDEIGFLLEAVQAPSKVLKYGREWHEIEAAIERAEHRYMLKELERKRLLKIRKIETKNGKRYMVALTSRGQAELLRLEVLSADLLSDGTMCMVVFDIPEQHRNLREQIRKLLKMAGFFPIQKSVWISPFDAGSALIALFSVKRARGWIRVYSAVEIKKNSTLS